MKTKGFYLMAIIPMLACCFSLFAQEPIQLSGYLPKVRTAEAMAVQRYTTYPMDYSTGLPNITIPLYEIKVGDITLPITLSYHSSGLRPNEAGGRIATGWTLNAEPSISKQVRGLDDLTPYYGFYPFNRGSYFELSDENVYNKRIADGKIDVMSDIYYYRLADRSGSFVMNSGKQFIPQPYNDMKIAGSPGSVTIEDDSGILYSFGGGSNYNERYLETLIPVRLLCKEITSKMTKAKINFIYNQSGLVDYDYRSYVSKDAVIIKSGEHPSFLPLMTKITNGMESTYEIHGPNQLHELPYDEEEYSPYVGAANVTESIITQPLREISFDHGRVVFEGDNRTQINISVRDKSNNVIKEIDLYCSPYDPYVDPNMQHRKLDSIRISVPGGEVQRYVFDYHSTSMAPDYDTRSIDYWGFYNGAYSSSNTSMVPSFSTVVNIGSGPVTYEHIGMNRMANAYAAIKGVLAKITDPNGAETTFEYEGNKTGIQYYSFYYGDLDAEMPPGYWILDDGPFVPQLNLDIPIGGLRVRRITEKDPETGKKLNREFSYGCLTDYWGDYIIESWGVPKKLISPKTFLTTQSHENAGTSPSQIKTWYCNPVDDITFNGGSPILYSRVIERKWSTGSDNVWTEYYYTTPRHDTFIGRIKADDCYYEDYQCIVANGKLEIIDFRDVTVPFTFKTFYDEEYGKLYKKIDYVESDTGRALVRKEEYENKLISRVWEGMSSNYVHRTKTYSPYSENESEQEIANNEVFYSPYPTRQEDAIITHNLVTNQKVTEYFPAGDPVVASKDYLYTNHYENDSGSAPKNKVRRITTHLSDDKQQEEYFTYSDGIYALTDYPEDLIPTSYSSKHPGGILTEHKTIIGNDTTYMRQKLQGVNDNFFVINSIRKKSAPGNNFDEVLRMEHNGYGNIIETEGLDGTPTAYIWSYNNQYIVAKVENSTFQRIRDTLDARMNISMENIDVIRDLRTRSDVTEHLESLRNLLPDARVHTYLYRPLVGMVSATDPSGKTIYYEYDTSNRLKRTYFKENTIERTIESYDYNVNKSNATL